MAVGPTADSVHAVAGCVPPLSLVTVLRSVSCVGRVLVNVQVALVPAAVAAALNVTLRVARFTVVEPAGTPVHAMSVNAKPAGSAPSVIVVAWPTVVSICTAPATGVPDVAVAIVWFAMPLLPLNVKLPVPPTLVLRIVTRGRRALLNVQVRSSPATGVTSNVVSLPLGVCPPERALVQL